MEQLFEMSEEKEKIISKIHSTPAPSSLPPPPPPPPPKPDLL